MFCVLIFIIFVYRCLILCATCYICVCLCLYFLCFPVCASCLVMLVFLLKPRKQQEAVNNVTNVKFCFCLQMLEYLFFSIKAKKATGGGRTAVQQLLTGCDCSLSEASTLQNQQESQYCSIFALLAIFAIFAIFSIFSIYPISARFAIFKFSTI